MVGPFEKPTRLHVVALELDVVQQTLCLGLRALAFEPAHLEQRRTETLTNVALLVIVKLTLLKHSQLMPENRAQARLRFRETGPWNLVENRVMRRLRWWPHLEQRETSLQNLAKNQTTTGILTWARLEPEEHGPLTTTACVKTPR